MIWCSHLFKKEMAGGNAKLFQYSCLENHKNSMKRQKDTIPEAEPLRSEGVQYATGEE